MHNIELIKTCLETKLFSYEIEYRKVDFVGPQVGNQDDKIRIMAMLLSFLSIMIYIWIRSEWQFGMRF